MPERAKLTLSELGELCARVRPSGCTFLFIHQAFRNRLAAIHPPLVVNLIKAVDFLPLD
jgi:hypothetical protein